MNKVVATTTPRSKMRASKPVVTVLANIYYGLSPYAGCKPTELAIAARNITIQRALIMGAITSDHKLTKIGMKILNAHRARHSKNRSTVMAGLDWR